jgi:hypothetical protein
MSYEQFVTKYHRYQYAPRTLSEAFRDGDYGTAIWRCEKAQTWRSDAFIESIVLLGAVFLLGMLIAPYLS